MEENREGHGLAEGKILSIWMILFVALILLPSVFRVSLGISHFYVQILIKVLEVSWEVGSKGMCLLQDMFNKKIKIFTFDRNAIMSAEKKSINLHVVCSFTLCDNLLSSVFNAI